MIKKPADNVCGFFYYLSELRITDRCKSRGGYLGGQYPWG